MKNEDLVATAAITALAAASILLIVELVRTLRDDRELALSERVAAGVAFALDRERGEHGEHHSTGRVGQTRGRILSAANVSADRSREPTDTTSGRTDGRIHRDQIENGTRGGAEATDRADGRDPGHEQAPAGADGCSASAAAVSAEAGDGTVSVEDEDNVRWDGTCYMRKGADCQRYSECLTRAQCMIWMDGRGSPDPSD